MSAQGPDAEDAAAAPDEPNLDAALAALDSVGLEGFEFTINADGTVTFIDFPPELIDIAYALNPDDPLVCERRAMASDAGGDGDDGE